MRRSTLGIGRGIPLSNTNQLWGLAWGALVFGEFAGMTNSGELLITVGSIIMIVGAVSISLAAPPPSEMENWKAAMHRECDRYGLDKENVAAVVAGNDPLADNKHPRRWWEILIVCVASGVFVWLAVGTRSAAHFCEYSVDDCADDWHDRSAGPVRNAAVEKNAILVSARRSDRPASNLKKVC
ncbi:MAG: hypothetical protein WDM87_02265 [Terracidiphilus sp.]